MNIKMNYFRSIQHLIKIYMLFMNMKNIVRV